MVDVAQLSLPKGGSVTASPKSLKERINETPCFMPWGNGGFGGWYQWMLEQSNLQNLIWNMRMCDAEKLHYAMCAALNEAHRKHTVLGTVCNYSNHPEDCDCGGFLTKKGA